MQNFDHVTLFIIFYPDLFIIKKELNLLKLHYGYLLFSICTLELFIRDYMFMP